MGDIRVSRELHLTEFQKEGMCGVIAQSYAARQGGAMLEVVWAGQKLYVRRSEDNGKTWQLVRTKAIQSRLLKKDYVQKCIK